MPLFLFRIYYIPFKYIMERGLMMLLHAFIIGFALYFIMIYVLQQNQAVAENRSLLLAAGTLIYMIVFGHGLPLKINKDI